MSMQKSLNKLWGNKLNQDFALALLSMSEMETLQRFLGDIMTEKEISEFGSRLRAAYMLSSGQKYDEIIVDTNLSTRTIARISKWLKEGYGGYSLVISKINNKHIEPARTD